VPLVVVISVVMFVGVFVFGELLLSGVERPPH
jgi:hypothetical protein